MDSHSSAWWAARSGIIGRDRRPPQSREQEPLSSTMRCAIYTRKSTEEGLNQEFNTLEAQREAAEAYISSQRHAGWTALAERYDDGGYTGANLERPALRKLLADIEGGNIDASWSTRWTCSAARCWILPA